jgi:glycine/D-amino acid oxidase-like deaminating enzyme
MRLYEPHAYDTARWPDSHWAATAPPPPPDPALAGDMRAEAAVVGAGITGLSAALALAARGVEVAVLDAAAPGWGASGRAGGFVCLGSAALDEAAILRRFGEGEARAFLRFQEAAVAEVAAMLDRHGIAADRGPDGEAVLAHRPQALAGLAEAAGLRARLGAARAEVLSRAALAERGLAGPGFHGGVLGPVGFPLHPLKYTLGLAAAARAAGVRLHGASPVTALSPEGGGWRLATPGGTVAARRVLVATNGYGADDLPGWLAGRRLPALSAILVTRPLTDAERSAQGFTAATMAYDSRRLLHYFRHLPCGRFLFGTRGGLSAAPAAQARMQRAARADFEALFPAWAGAATERFWSGLVCLTGSLTPYAGPVPGAPGLWAAFGWHGNGIAAGTLAGARTGAAMAGEAPGLPGVLTTPPARFPLPRFRRGLLALVYAAARLTDGRPPG